MSLTVKLQVFEGPLDLLLHLIEKNKVDIYDIPIVLITDQYLDYIKQMQDAQTAVAVKKSEGRTLYNEKLFAGKLDTLKELGQIKKFALLYWKNLSKPVLFSQLFQRISTLKKEHLFYLKRSWFLS